MVAMSRTVRFTKGHGTRNDFVLLDDRDGEFALTATMAAALADRRSGIGGDGVIRVAPTSSAREDEVRAQADHAPWFMDYRNADGSIAEMCGNGLRVFARHLVNEQREPAGEFVVATRAGLRQVRIAEDGLISTSMGEVTLRGRPVDVELDGRRWPATGVDVGNPHAVVSVDADTLPMLDLTTAPVWEPAGAFPDGVNVEFVVAENPGALNMRVFERGSGETESCGTGVVAVAAAYRDASGFDGPVQVRVPGGQLSVEFQGGEAWLTGPAVVYAHGEFWR